MIHIADYTTKDLAADIVGIHDMSNPLVVRGAKAIDAAIAAAVAAERERCAKVADNQHAHVDCPEDECCGLEIAAAIRALK